MQWLRTSPSVLRPHAPRQARVCQEPAHRFRLSLWSRCAGARVVGCPQPPQAGALVRPRNIMHRTLYAMGRSRIETVRQPTHSRAPAPLRIICTMLNGRAVSLREPVRCGAAHHVGYPRPWPVRVGRLQRLRRLRCGLGRPGARPKQPSSHIFPFSCGSSASYPEARLAALQSIHPVLGESRVRCAATRP